MLLIAAVSPGSAAARRGIEPGDRLITINGREIRDCIDFQFWVSEERVSLRIGKRNGSQRRVTFLKEPDDTLGIEPAPFPVRRCRNHCIFCFVDQMPGGCRATLSVKDDDYRASFLFGNYITLTNLREEDWKRIFEQRLSPLYVSVHATEPALRRSILKNPSAPDIMVGLRRLASGGIRVHSQLVLCPGINDGEHLVKSVQDLASLYPAVQSVAAVPVGLTKHRKGLFKLKPYSRRQARRVVETVERLGRQFKRRLGTRFVFPSDEFYIKAGSFFPAASYYEDFPQLENGVGMVAEFLRETRRTRVPAAWGTERATVVSGLSFRKVIQPVIERLRRDFGAPVRLLEVTNGFFGPTVTVTGLLTGRDILRTLKGKRVGSLVLIPRNILKDDGRTFLDDLTIDDLAKEIGVPVKPVEGFGDLLRQVSARGRVPADARRRKR